MTTANRRQILGLAGVVGGIGLLSACGGVKTGTSGGSSSGSFPTKDIEMSVGFAAGGSTDVMTRALTDPVGKSLGVTLPVINTPGANGVLAAKELSQKLADGYAIGTVNASTFTITPLAVAENERVAIDDLEVICGFTQDDYVLASHSKSSLKSIDDMKKAGKRITYGTTGIGSGAQLCAALTFALTGIDGEDVPFKGDAPAITALLGEQIDVASIQLAAAMEYFKSGELQPVAVFSEEPLPQVPEIKTAKQQGVNFAVTQYRTLCAPVGIPQDAKDALLKAFKEAVEAPEFKKFCEERVLRPTFFGADEMTKLLREAAEQNKKLVEDNGINLAG